MIHLYTSVLIDTLTGPRRSAQRMRELIHDGERMMLSSIVAFEWLRGPRTPEEIADQEALFPVSESVPFGDEEALFAAAAYRKIKRASGREIDLAIAACAIVHNAQLWTLNLGDYKDIPNLRLLL